MHHSISRSQLNDAAAMRLICLPYAGGGSSPYHRWRPMLPREVDLLPLALPGHDGRLNEALYTDLKSLAGALTEDLSRFALDRPYVLLGHSMGALLAFEIARSLRRDGHRLPDLLVISACRPPHAVNVRERLSNLPDRELVDVLQDRYGGIPLAVRDNAELQELLLPALRADFQMIETYAYTDEPPLDVPFLVMGGADDPAVSAGQLMEWRRHTTQDCSVRLLPGGHFFLFAGLAPSTNQPELKREAPTTGLRVIIAHLEKCLALNLNQDSV